jgi:hypothetical protein
MASVDPRKVQWHHDSINEKAVQHYMRHPNKPFDGQSGQVYIERGRDGRLYGANGRHRAEAARRTGRRLDVRIVDNPQRTSAFTSGGCLGMVMFVVVAVGLVRRGLA